MSGRRPIPPPWAGRLLARFCRPALYEEIVGDLEEVYHTRRQRWGAFTAGALHAWEVLFFLRTHVLRRRPSYAQARGPIMWSNYLKVALRHLKRHRGYAFINISGLAVSIACCILILLFVQDELRYDRHHDNADRIYRLIRSYEDDGDYAGIAKVTGPWGTTARHELPEVEQAARFVIFGQTLMRRGETQAYEQGGFLADSTAFAVFDADLLHGDPATALLAPASVVLTRSLAEAYFGTADALGETVWFDEAPHTVTGVMADWPTQSHFHPRFLVALTGYDHPSHDDWIRWNQYYTYLLLREGADPEAVAAKFEALLPRYIGEEAENYTAALQPLTRIHLHSRLFREIQANSDVAYVYLFSAIAFFILLIACVNFMNLSTARSAGRAREVGVRKAAGARRSALVGQFLGESMLLSAIAALLALLLIPLLLPFFNQLTGKTLAMADLLGWPFVLGLLGTVGFVGLAAGSYPAFVLSSYQPVVVLKGLFRSGGRARLREGLVVFQFAISAGLIMATGIVGRQLQYIQDKPLGFDQEQIVLLPVREPSMLAAHETVKEALRAHPNVVEVSISANAPGGGDYGIPVRPEGVADEDIPPIRILVVDHDFLDVYGMEMAAGRGFSTAHPTDANAYLLNEEAARQLGWTQPVGRMIAMPAIEREAAPVLGVVKDFHFRSMREQIAPLVFMMAPAPNWYSFYSVKVRAEGMAETLAFLEAQWVAFDPAHPFTYSFFDEGFAALHVQEQRLGTLMGYFTALAIVIACLGLFGLASFMAQQRTKEIGVRKVLGASWGGIVVLLCTAFIRLVAVALLIALPVGYFAMDRWLQGFAYRTSIGPDLFLLAGLTTLGVALLTVSFQAVRAALANPVRALRYE